MSVLFLRMQDIVVAEEEVTSKVVEEEVFHDLHKS